MTIPQMIETIYSRLNISCEKCSELGKVERFIERCGEDYRGCLINECLTTLESKFGISRNDLLYSTFFRLLLDNWNTIKDKITVVNGEIQFEPPTTVTGNPVKFTATEETPIGVVATWKPKQEETPSFTDISNYTSSEILAVDYLPVSQSGGYGDIQLDFPKGIYGGELNVITGEGKETWAIRQLDGTETCGAWAAVNGFWVSVPEMAKHPTGTYGGCCDRIPVADTLNLAETEAVVVMGWKNNVVYFMQQTDFQSVDEWKEYLAAQYAAGTPVTIVYKLATPIPFTATATNGNPEQIKAYTGNNEISTDWEHVTFTVTGRIQNVE